MVTVRGWALALALACCVHVEAHACEPAAAGPAPGAWRLAWSEEFGGDKIDAQTWSHEIDCWGGGNSERQCYTNFPENSRVEGGCLIITARLETVAGPAWPAHLRGREGHDAKEVKEQPFSSARLTTKNKADWKYGRFEVRARLPEGQGVWPAIWMLPTEEIYGPWALSGEIDIIEAVNLGTRCKTCKGGIENEIHGTIHYGGKWPQNKFIGKETQLPAVPPGGQEFHVFAVEWTEGRIDWFLDGRRYHSVTSSAWSPLIGGLAGKKEAPFDQRFHLLINLAVGGDWPERENEGGVLFKAFPAELLVDWVRVYDCPADPASSKACRSPS